jgi:hypothetical protein
VKTHRLASLALATSLICGCAHSDPNAVKVQGEVAATALATPEPTPTAVPTECPEDGTDIRAIQPDLVTPASTAAPIASRSTVRIEAVPGPSRTDCIGVSGIVLGRLGPHLYVAATVGHAFSDANEAWVVPWQGAPKYRGKIMGFDTNPDLAIISFLCDACPEHISSAKDAPSIPDELAKVQIVGHTSGSITTLAHPAEMSSGPLDFGTAGKTDAYVTTAVTGAGAAGDGIWTRDGGLLGMGFFERPDPEREYRRHSHDRRKTCRRARRARAGNRATA